MDNTYEVLQNVNIEVNGDTYTIVVFVNGYPFTANAFTAKSALATAAALAKKLDVYVNYNAEVMIRLGDE